MLGALILIPIIFLGIALIMIIAQWKVFTKAGQPGWASIIPIYNIIVFCQIAGKPFWFIFIPIYGPIAILHGVSKAFGKEAGFTVGMILLPIIFLPMLGFSKSIQFVGPGGVAKTA
ncbi:MAG: hypothetical protein K0S32_163 [Bacteroidetes bacterium]|jgi:hypothetical protein|nr:hypothetical protein [Bacteroidota bacterium]